MCASCHDLSTSSAENTSSPDDLPAQSILRCGILIDGLSDAPLRDQRITIMAGRIVAVEDFDQSPQSTHSNTVTDLSDFTCLPGLINTHVHFDSNPEDSVDYSVYARRTREENLQLVLDNAETTLLTGFTTVRHVGAWFPDTVYRARSLIQQGEALGPRIQTAGPYLTVPGGGGDLTFPEIPTDRIPGESQQGIGRTPEEFSERAEAALPISPDGGEAEEEAVSSTHGIRRGPLADGPTIQASSTKALHNGMNSSVLFDQLKDIRKTVSIPLILMGYFNPILQYGIEAFCKKCKEIGIWFNYSRPSSRSISRGIPNYF